jgi:hypothetical protein
MVVGPAFCKPGEPLALEAVVPIRTRRADSIMARSKITELLTKAVYTNATGFTSIDRAACDRGWVHIRVLDGTNSGTKIDQIGAFTRFSHWWSGSEKG